MPESRFVPVSAAIVGVQKAATTSLYALLLQHDHVARARKEWHFFEDEKRDWITPDYSGYGAVARSPLQQIAIDATPAYLFWPRALERMRAYNPGMRLIASFRDPIERAFSHWCMYRAQLPRYPEFSRLVAEPESSTVLEAVPDGWNQFRMRRRTMVARGLYGAQLRRGLDLFPRDQWCLLDFRDIAGDPVGTGGRVVGFLGLPPYAEPPKPRFKLASSDDLSGTPPTADDVRRLADRFGDDLGEFTALSGLDTGHWATRQVLDGRLDPAELAERLARKAGLLG